MSTKYDVINAFPIYGWSGAIQKPDSGRIVCNFYFFIKSNSLAYKTKNRTKKSLILLSYFESRYYFCQKMASAKLRAPGNKR